MSHFYGIMSGARGAATRCGTKSSGIEAHVRGWGIGAKAEVRHMRSLGADGADIVEANSDIVQAQSIALLAEKMGCLPSFENENSVRPAIAKAVTSPE